MELNKARLIVLKKFEAVLSSKTVNEVRSSTLLLYASLLSQVCSDIMTKESGHSLCAVDLQGFLRHSIEPHLTKIQNGNVRVQMLWILLRFMEPERINSANAHVRRVRQEAYLRLIENELVHIQSIKVQQNMLKELVHLYYLCGVLGWQRSIYWRI